MENTNSNENKILNGKTVLIIDDDVFLLEMYVKKFKQFGTEIQSAMNGEEALEKLRDGLKPDIILFDMIMPKVDGITLIKTIKEEGLIPDAAKIVLSNQGESSDISEMKQYGIDGYIIKAMFTPSEIVDEVIKIYKEKHGL